MVPLVSYCYRRPRNSCLDNLRHTPKSNDIIAIRRRIYLIALLIWPLLNHEHLTLNITRSIKAKLRHSSFINIVNNQRMRLVKSLIKNSILSHQVVSQSFANKHAIITSKGFIEQLSRLNSWVHNKVRFNHNGSWWRFFWFLISFPVKGFRLINGIRPLYKTNHNLITLLMFCVLLLFEIFPAFKNHYTLCMVMSTEKLNSLDWE